MANFRLCRCHVNSIKVAERVCHFAFESIYPMIRTAIQAMMIQSIYRRFYRGVLLPFSKKKFTHHFQVCLITLKDQLFSFLLLLRIPGVRTLHPLDPSHQVFDFLHIVIVLLSTRNSELKTQSRS